MNALPEFLEIAPAVRRALDARAPVVALESTIISHGMPFPQNVETARAVERVVAEEGAVPATIAILGGRMRVGLNDEDLQRLSSSKGVLKLSRADLPAALASGTDGATTVAATMICANLAGISVFATGGIGGVHRGAERTMDVSADLQELARTPVIVVCAGIKALLDVPKTLEVLETLGVPAITFGAAEVPAFWSRSSGIPAALRIDSIEELVRFARIQRALDTSGGTLVMQPIEESDEIPAPEMRGYIERAIDEARADGARGKAATPWLLQRISALTSGRSLAANIALVKNNARLAAKLALALSA